MTSPTPLSTIIALARAGALERAWDSFGAAGYDRRTDDPAALNVKGRLLKDRAIRAQGEARRRLYQLSSEAYRASAALQPGTYPLINAATLALLSGDRAQAEEIAREVLERIAREPEEPETPYWRAATEAEALLLLGRIDEAKAQIETTIAAAPKAWEDQASTLRQFVLIHEAIDADAAWLDLLRPPRSLSYSGDAGTRGVPDPVEQIAAERIGFGFGALAAGAEIEVAEALIAAGAELHVVLPSDVESFARSRVDPFGADWRARFDAALVAADTVHLVRPLPGEAEPARRALAAEIARGAARLNAERLISEAQDLSLSGDDARREEAEPPGPPLLALLSISVGAASDAGFEERLEAVREALQTATGIVLAPHLDGDCVLIGFAAVVDGAEAARLVHARLRGRMPLRIGGHYGFIPTLRDPFLDRTRPTQAGTAILQAIGQAAPPDTVCVSLDFAAALAAAEEGPSCAHWIGELHAFDGGTPIALYALRPLASGD